MICYTLAPLMLAIDRIRWLVTYDDQNVFWVQFPYNSSFAFINVAKFFLYILLLLRVYHSFRNSVFEYNLKFIICITVFCCLFQIVYYCVIFRFWWPHHIWVPVQVMDGLILVAILLMLVSRLFKASQKLGDNVLVAVLSKVTVLTVVTLLTTNLLAAVYCEIWRLNTIDPVWQYLVDSLMINADSVINSFCVYLMLGFNVKQYVCCCKGCHLSVVWCYSKCLRNNMDV